MTMPSQIAILNVSVCLRAAKIVLCARRRMSVNHFLESWLQLTKNRYLLGRLTVRGVEVEGVGCQEYRVPHTTP